MKALLIIDMQLGSFRPYTSRFDTLMIIDRINKLSEHFRKNKDKIIFIQHDGSAENTFLPGSDDWKILPELIRDADDSLISKTANDSFYKTKLKDLLKQNKIIELYLTGCATETVDIKGFEANGTMDFKIYNVLGEVVRSYSANSSTFTFDRGTLSSGIYSYVLSQNNSVLRSGKIIAQ